MVKKGSKRGLNTGNTIRRCLKEQNLYKHKKYGYFVVTSDVTSDDSLSAKSTLKDVSAVIPSNGYTHLEFSLNKKKRWELPECIKQKIHKEQDSPNVQVWYQK